MELIAIKTGSNEGVYFLGYDKNALYPFSKLPQMQMHVDGDVVSLDLRKETIDALIKALRKIKETFPESIGP